MNQGTIFHVTMVTSYSTMPFNAVDIKYNTVSVHFEPDWCFIERPNGIIVRDVNNLVN